jgi:hypothetical protein
MISRKDELFGVRRIYVNIVREGITIIGPCIVTFVGSNSFAFRLDNDEFVSAHIHMDFSPQVFREITILS